MAKTSLLNQTSGQKYCMSLIKQSPYNSKSDVKSKLKEKYQDTITSKPIMRKELSVTDRSTTFTDLFQKAKKQWQVNFLQANANLYGFIKKESNKPSNLLFLFSSYYHRK